MFDYLQRAVGYFFDLARGLLAGIVGRVLGTLGIGFASYSLLLPSIVAFIQQHLNALTPQQQALAGAIHIDVFCTMVFSALAWKLGTRVKPIRIGGQDAQQ
jgi:hypothetical protein